MLLSSFAPTVRSAAWRSSPWVPRTRMAVFRSDAWGELACMMMQSKASVKADDRHHVNDFCQQEPKGVRAELRG